MKIDLDHHSGEPIYRQIVEAVKFEVARGGLSDGDRLPSIRDLANTLSINMRTVVKAYEELVREGLAVMQQGRGVFITPPQGTLPAARRRQVITDLVRRLLAEARRLGADSSEVQSVLQSVAAEMEQTHET
ncbi:MAG: GntR family transcriptional regulator [Planctomycetaceae bacterium]|nr:GntR family transcriptional regulator [Planctomycetaceae bacterium]